MEFEIIATKEQGGEKEVDIGDTLAPTGTAGAEWLVYVIWVQSKRPVLTMSGGLLRLIECSAREAWLLGNGDHPVNY